MWLVQRIEAENFMSFRRVDLDLSRYKGITLIEGKRSGAGKSNGAGKSTIFDMIHWCLFGTIARKPRYVEKLRHRFAGPKDRLLVSITFDVDGEEIVVERTRSKDPTLNIFRGKVVQGTNTKAPIAGTQRVIETIFGTAAEFTATAMFSGGKGFCQLGDSERKELLEKMSGAYRFVAAGVVAKKKLDVLLADVQRHTDAKVTQDARLADAQEGKRTIYGNNVHTFSVNTVAYYEQLFMCQELAENVHRQCDLVNDALRQGYEKAAATAAKLKAAEALVATADADVQRLVADTAKADAACAVKRDQVRAADEAVRLASANTHPDTCPHCRQRWPQLDNKNSAEVVKARKDDADKFRSELKPLDTNLAVAKEAQRDAEDRRRRLRQDAATLRIESDSKPEREALSEMYAAEATLAGACSKLREIEDKLDIDAVFSPDTTRYDTVITDANAKLATISAEIAAGEQQRRRLDFWKKGFARNAFPSFLLDSSIPRMNDVVGRIASELSDGELLVSFNPALARGNGDVFAVEVTYADGADDYDMTSNGEHVRVDVPVLFAVRDLVESQGRNRCGQLFLDELFDGTDAAFAEAMMAMLRNNFAHKPIFMVSHEDAVKSLCDNSLIVRKKKREAEIVAA